ncbi:MAG: beta-ketoacyl-[acyl-carrier-protein] synthase family protein [Castellaniella sp.]|uniref:beta-ketoacyl-[acyl-carrier-protein] synthase family protein n=1 Tax=Castellaniella sp. TaxID=1955812 RepID=UPI003A8426FF
MKHRRVVVTGLGLTTPVGLSTQAAFDALMAGQCGIKDHPRLALGRRVGHIDADLTFGEHPMQVRQMDRTTLLARHAATQALGQADLTAGQQTRTGVFYGTGIGGVSTFTEAIEAFHHLTPKRPILAVPATMPNAAAALIAQTLKSMAEAQTYATACSAGAVAIGEAFRRLRDGYLDVAIAGGAESILIPSIIAAWEQLRVLSPDPADPDTGNCRPFSRRRAGFALSEGAAMMVLETLSHALARGATPIAEICGYGVSNDGTHPLRPDHIGQALAMQRCLDDAGLVPAQVGYINAHATGTHVGDRIETLAIKQVFGAHARSLPVSSIKGAVGHMIGAAGAVEAAVTALSVQQGLIAPTLFHEAGDPDCDLDYVPGQARRVPTLSVAISNSFGMGGNNAVLAFRKFV